MELPKQLTDDEKTRLRAQDERLVSEHRAKQLEKDAKKYWDIFYKRNETKFFKDRHWTIREFKNLLDLHVDSYERKVLFEAGCGVGNLIIPLIEEGLNYFYLAGDISPRAIEFLKKHPLFDEEIINAFQADITSDDLHEHVSPNSVDVTTLVFVLSAVHPEKFAKVLENIYKLLKPNGILLFRDYGLYDMAQIRFKAGQKISENFYMRQDGTRSYYFSKEFMEELLQKAGFEVIQNEYVHRRTVNKKEGIDVPRIFLQAKARKPEG